VPPSHFIFEPPILQLSEPDDTSDSEDDFSSHWQSAKDYTETNPSSFPEYQPGEIPGEIDDDPEKTLEERLYAELCPTTQPRHEFIPMGRLNSIINEAAVRREMDRDPILSRLQDDQKATLTKQICQPHRIATSPRGVYTSYRKIFAILVLIYEVDQITQFLNYEVTDSDLPLVNPEGSRNFELRRSHAPKEALQCFEGWKIGHKRQFFEWQWAMLAPFLSRTRDGQVAFYDFPDRTVLPFTKEATQSHQKEYEPLERAEGGYGDVFKVQIHPEHHNFQDYIVSAPENNVNLANMISTNNFEVHRTRLRSETSTLQRSRILQ
jgi:hypothetical protein